MEEYRLPKGFFKKNPLEELSAAIISDYSVDVIDGFGDNIYDIMRRQQLVCCLENIK